MSLADELLADLEDDADQEQDDHENENMQNEADNEDDDLSDIEDVDAPKNSGNVKSDGNSEMDVTMDTTGTIREIARLKDGPQLTKILKEIIEFKEKPSRAEIVGPLEADPEYILTVRANNITVEIDNEINIIHKFVKDIYNIRFPELDSLVPTPFEYIRTVKELGNEIENAKNSKILPGIIPSAAIMIVSVTASTTQGTLLSSEELEKVNEACDMAIALNDSRTTIEEYIQSRMSFIAPNLTNIVGAPTAAKLMGVAGGLTKLSQIPACNLLVLGSQKRTLAGFSTTAVLPHTGYIYYSDFIQKQPPDIRKKLARLVASKCTLAARIDAFHESNSGSMGEQMKEQIDAKIDKWLEPPPVKSIKPLAAPIDKISKRRGGRRARKLKERLGMTDIRKQANRLNFAEIEEDAYQNDLGFSLGTLGNKSKSGRIRAAAVDTKTRARISKTLQQKLAKANQGYGGTTTIRKAVSGTASSVAFTPLQGLEIVNPLAAENKVAEANQKYFSTTGGFTSVKKV